MRRRSYVTVCLLIIAIIVCVVYRAIIWPFVVAIWTFVVTNWPSIFSNFGIASATVILAIYGIVSNWWSHKRRLLDSRQKLIHDLHVSLAEFDQVCRRQLDSNTPPGSVLSSSARSALVRFSEAKVQSRHVTPEYLSVVVDRLADELTRIATVDEHTVGDVKELLPTIIFMISDLTILSSRYEETFQIHKVNRLSRFLFRIHDLNEICCPKPDCETWNSPLYKFCRECGKNLNPLSRTYWVCPKCPKNVDNEYSAKYKYCVRCGSSLDKDAHERPFLSNVNYYEKAEKESEDGTSDGS